MDQNFSTSFSVSTPPAKIIEAICNVAGWWATNISGDTKKINDIFTVRFGKTFSIVKVVDVIPGKKIVWSVIDCDLPLFPNAKDWLNTKLIWELDHKDNYTTVTMTHYGLTPDKSCYVDCKKGWTYYVCESLQKLITEGRGMPGTGIFSYIIFRQRRYEGLLYFKDDPLPDYPVGFIYADVGETKGEQVTGVNMVKEYHSKSFDPQFLRGDYFMILKNEPIYQNIVPLDDIGQMI